REGELAEARKFLLRLGEDHLGPPGAHVTAAVEAITDVERLEALGKRLLRAESWEDLLGPRPGGDDHDDGRSHNPRRKSGSGSVSPRGRDLSYYRFVSSQRAKFFRAAFSVRQSAFAARAASKAVRAWRPSGLP